MNPRARTVKTYIGLFCILLPLYFGLFTMALAGLRIGIFPPGSAKVGMRAEGPETIAAREATGSVLAASLLIAVF